MNKFLMSFFFLLPVVLLFGQAAPNVVIIYADDMGWGDVGYHGFDDVLTPNIDALAKGGTQFSQGYVSASVCGPSRSGLLTGVYQQRLGIYGNGGGTHVLKSQPLLFEELKTKNYECGVVGKWGIGEDIEEILPNNRGVDFYYGFLGGAHSYTESSTDSTIKKSKSPIWRNDKVEPNIKDSNGYLTEMFTNEGVDFIKRTSITNKPFCLYLAYNAVHHPWVVPQSYQNRLEDLDVPEERKIFAAMVLALDDGVGEIMKTLREKGIEENTLVFFISDNGSPRGQGFTEPKVKRTSAETTMSSTGGFRGFKGDTYEGGIRVPFIMYWPGKVEKGKIYDKPVVNLDVVPTVLARVGITEATTGFDFDGVDLLPYVAGKGQEEEPHETLYWRRGDDYAIRDGYWKLAWNDQGLSAEIQLFDLENDPYETTNIASRYPKKAQELQNKFDAWDTSLADNQTGKVIRSRHTKYLEGVERDVAVYNTKVKDRGEKEVKGKSSRKYILN